MSDLAALRSYWGTFPTHCLFLSPFLCLSPVFTPSLETLFSNK